MKKTQNNKKKEFIMLPPPIYEQLFIAFFHNDMELTKKLKTKYTKDELKKNYENHIFNIKNNEPEFYQENLELYKDFDSWFNIIIML